MHFIKTTTRGQLKPVDVALLAQQMCNIYHGREYYKLGVIDEQATSDYLDWNVGSIKYSYTPCMGYIYMDAHAVTPVVLAAAFHHANRWGSRGYRYANSAKNQFTVEKIEEEISVTVMNGTKNIHKKRSRSFEWVITTNSYMMQYTCAGKVPPSQQLMASMCTIVVDINHSIELPHLYRCVGFPPLQKNIKIYPTVVWLSYSMGLDVHLMKHTDMQMYALAMPLYVPLKIACTSWSTSVFHNAPDMSMLANSTELAPGTHCLVCRKKLFSHHYVVQHTNYATICKLCMHHTHYQPIYTRITRRTGISHQQFIEEMGEEHKVLQDIQKWVETRPTVGDTEMEMHIDAPGIYGTAGSDRTYQTYLEQIHTFKNNTTLFRFACMR